eukprot:CAMPEP_0194038982 /NCGR_PEP_ID=MMETSP0009_2-20130614/11181_1 /TAXON_ID=210454 /ORGANISM="Grammatophora oceanica, Strain CCMP 410" /LENGTH=104 /DNA_ID=CAMNT_0038681667 /DNA_START=42 /DNA_END=356 /DNA_ORIENTATION=-
MAQQAISSGHVSTLNCTSLVEAIDEFQVRRNRTRYDLAQICPHSDVFEALIDTTIRSEEMLLPADERDSDTINVDMEEIRFKFCDADMDKIYQDPDWQHFFNDL